MKFVDRSLEFKVQLHFLLFFLLLLAFVCFDLVLRLLRNVVHRLQQLAHTDVDLNNAPVVL